ncbi:MAG: twin-arginine translocase TatA/TatE family subunit [Planctomycetia bacterium]|nr:MAG: twin-arginine translocase TatA/TatE family subunit [Planctomycetia bacterium]
MLSLSGLNLLAWTPFDPWHLLVIGIVALLLFGKRLPDVGRSLGRGISEFKKGLKDVGEELNKDDEASSGRLTPPRDGGESRESRREPAETGSGENRDR